MTDVGLNFLFDSLDTLDKRTVQVLSLSLQRHRDSAEITIDSRPCECVLCLSVHQFRWIVHKEKQFIPATLHTRQEQPPTSEPVLALFDRYFSTPRVHRSPKSTPSAGPTHNHLLFLVRRTIQVSPIGHFIPRPKNTLADRPLTDPFVRASLVSQSIAAPVHKVKHSLNQVTCNVSTLFHFTRVARCMYQPMAKWTSGR